MKFFDCDIKKPVDGQFCVIKQKSGNVIPYLYSYYENSGFPYNLNITKWAPAPKHVLIDKSGWSSEYWGDELPKERCECLVCCEDSKLVRYAYFLKEKDKFLGVSKVVAFMVIA